MRGLCCVTELAAPLHISTLVLSKGAEGCKPVERLSLKDPTAYA